MRDARRALPSIGSLLETGAVRELLARTPRALVVEAIRSTVKVARDDPRQAPADEPGWAAAIEQAVARRGRPSLRRVLNGTGVVLHTNLGRAPLAAVAVEALVETASGFTNLEYDMERGVRGSRSAHCTAILQELTGAEDALVVNNCAAALVLALNTLASGREVIVSRGELVEIGGSFRIPDIMARSGARLREVGTTNRTHLADYRTAAGPETGAIVKIHRGNFAMSGFVAEAGAAELAALAAERQVPFLHDLGSGLLLSLEAHGLSGEPTAADAVRMGADLVVMSGDKLLGGPQAGIILGRSPAVAALRANPLARAVRVDKLTLAALHATLVLYRDPARALREVPALAMLTAPYETLRARAATICNALSVAGRSVKVVDDAATVGAGAFPTAALPSVAIEVRGDATSLEQRLRAGDPPVIARITDGGVRVNLRSILPNEDEDLVAALQRALE